MSHTLWLWVGFNIFVLVMLALDLLVFHRKSHEVSFKEATAWSIVWIALGLAFSGFIYVDYNKYNRTPDGTILYPDPIAAPDAPVIAADAPEAAPLSDTPDTTAAPDMTTAPEATVADTHAPDNIPVKDEIIDGRDAVVLYLTGYVVEKALSVDNLFVFLVIFSFFAVPGILQHRVLFWGIIGALVFRAIFIFMGVALINKFEWLLYVFGGFLIYTGLKMLKKSDEEIHPEHNPMLKLVRKFFPLTNDFEGDHFFVRRAGKLFATPMLVTLLIVETTDVIFAVDSIPAIIGITRDPFLIYTSNVFAILGLRALYFALAGFMKLLGYLHYGLSAILVFVGLKMLALMFHWHVSPPISLSIIGAILVITVVVSLMFPPKVETAPPPTSDEPAEL